MMHGLLIYFHILATMPGNLDYLQVQMSQPFSGQQVLVLPPVGLSGWKVPSS